MTCKKCSAQMAEGSIVCPYCLSSVDGRKKRRTIAIIAVAAVCAAALAAALIILL